MKSWSARALGRAGIRLGGTLVCVLFWTTSGFAQDLVYSRLGKFPDESYGAVVAGVGDVDGDGVRDILVGADDAPSANGDVYVTGRFEVISGRTGTLLMEVRSYGPFASENLLGSSVDSIPDVNGDGTPDLLVGTQRRARVYSGSDASLLVDGDPITPGLAPGKAWVGNDVAGVGDVNGDSIPDFVSGTIRQGVDMIGIPHFGAVIGYSGLDGSLLWHFTELHPGDKLGHSVDGGADFDGDGVPDVLAGARDEGSGTVRVLSGRDGSVLRTIHAPASMFLFGQDVAIGGDSDGDGTPDLLVGTSGKAVLEGAVPVYSGATGELLLRLTCPPPMSTSYSEFGRRVAGVGDLDGDGARDLAVGEPSANSPYRSGRAHVYSGRTGSLLWSAHAAPDPNTTDVFGWRIAGLGDLNGDGVPEVVVGAPEGPSTFHTYGPGYIRVLSGRPLRFVGLEHEVSLATGGDAPFLLKAGPDHAGEFYQVLGSASGVRPGFDYGAVHVPLNSDPYFGHTLFHPNTPLLDRFLGKLDDRGRANAVLRVPPGLSPALVGLTLHHSFVTDVFLGIELASNAVPLTLLP